MKYREAVGALSGTRVVISGLRCVVSGNRADGQMSKWVILVILGSLLGVCQASLPYGVSLWTISVPFQDWSSVLCFWTGMFDVTYQPSDHFTVITQL